jgi:hypothetical protein
MDSLCRHDHPGGDGVSNGANLNDGMDGMAAGNSAIIGVALGILAYVSSHMEFAAYLNIMYIPGSQELVVFMCAFVGALIGFLWYNAYPAQVFMGDTVRSLSEASSACAPSSSTRNCCCPSSAAYSL